MPWTEADIGDQAGRIALITGANSGIGWEAARALAEHGATVVLACRSETKCAESADRIRASAPQATLHHLVVELGDLASVRGAAAALPVAHIDMLINNAGVMAIPRRETTDGFEMQLGVNHLGHFALTGLLLEKLADDARVVHVSSHAHKMGQMNWPDLMHTKRYERWTAYGQSKLANLLFHFELQARFEKAGGHRKSVACHPGYSATNLVYRGPEYDGRSWMKPIFTLGHALIAQGPKPGAAPTLFAATSATIEGGEYIGPQGPLELWGAPVQVGRNRKAENAQDATRLWDTSVELTDVTYLN